MQKRRYSSCPDCGIRMKKTGAKRESQAKDFSGKALYDYEYECPGCSKHYVYVVDRDWLDDRLETLQSVSRGGMW